MEEFQVIQPAPALTPYVKHYWLLKTVGNVVMQRTVPTGMMSLVFHRGERLLSIRENRFHPRAFLCGQERTFDDLQYDGQVNMISVVFRPAGVRAFFNLPADRLMELRLSAADIEDRKLAALEVSLGSTENDNPCILLIEQFLLRRLMRPAEHNLRRVDAAIDLIHSGEANISVLADAACLGHRQFGRVFSEYVGAHPKEFSRTIRFQRALHLLETDPTIEWAALASDCGWFDQSHMIKEFKTLSGYTPGEYLAACSPHSDYFS